MSDEIKQSIGDATLKGQDSLMAQESNSGKTPKTFTESEHKKAIEDAIAQYGDRIKRERIDPIARELTEFKIQVQKEKDEAEEEAVADDMPALTALRENRRKKAKVEELTEREAKLVKREADLVGIIERDRILTRTQLAAEVATEKGVSVDGILKGIALTKEESREAMVAVAELLPQVKERGVLISDSGRTNRGGESLEGLSSGELLRKAHSQKK